VAVSAPMRRPSCDHAAPDAQARGSKVGVGKIAPPTPPLPTNAASWYAIIHAAWSIASRADR
jgi:hypothetical protein